MLGQFADDTHANPHICVATQSCPATKHIVFSPIHSPLHLLFLALQRISQKPKQGGDHGQT
jgi:hypothetical protein